MKQLLTSLAILVSLISCSSKHPVTVVGIRLGLPVESQIESAIDSNKLHENPRTKHQCFDLTDSIKGEPFFYNFLFNEQGERILAEVTVFYLDSRFFDYYIKGPVVTDYQKHYILESYQNKYGQGKIFGNIDSACYIEWRIGLLEIDLQFNPLSENDEKMCYLYTHGFSFRSTISGEEIYPPIIEFPLWGCTAIYRYKKSYRDKLEKSGKRIEKNI